MLLVLEKLLLGVTLAAPIGPVSIEMIKRGLSKGFLSAFVVRLGGAMGNSLCLIAAYFGASLFMNSDTKMGICSLIGALVLGYLGVKSILDKRTHQYNSPVAPTNNANNTINQKEYNLANGLLTGFILSIVNPIGIVFWLSIFAASVDQSGETKALLGLAQNFVVIAGVLTWGVMLSGLLEIGKRFFNPKWIKMINLAAGVMLIYFALKYMYKAALYLLPIFN
jgi:threonine/homoserine/homoserine lactone efflux protein